jgi:hypothetical protein
MEALDATVGGIRAPLDQAASLEPIDQARDGNGFDFADGCHLVLRHTGLAIEARENDPLRARHRMRDARLLVKAGPERARHVVQDDEKIAVK